ncbi:hypothetical protein [Haliea sp.]
MRNTLLLLLAMMLPFSTTAREPLVLDLDMDADTLSMAHNIEDFLFQRTFSFSPNVPGDLHESFKRQEFNGYLVASALVRIDGEVAGVATEQEYVYRDPDSGAPRARSAWLITLTREGLRGFLAVEQVEDASKVFNLAQKVMQEPNAQWEDSFKSFLSTHGEARLEMATDDLSDYADGKFEEYNMLNPADFARLGRFRARIQFVIHPAH